MAALKGDRLPETARRYPDETRSDMQQQVKIRVAHTHKMVMDGWSKVKGGEYIHATGRRVRRDARGYWESIGGPSDGAFWQTMHWAMFQATKG